ncbi:MAG TPA: hypothetical protein VMG62_07510, partial [Solirubrobacteraceae bacterium]|nr:hypothetical protein [Solirubrobacteraceae bacterium]
MTATQTYEERLGHFDRTVEELQRSFVEAVEHLRQAPQADDSYEQRWQEIADRLKGLRYEIKAEDYDKEQLAILATALLDM